MVINYIRSNAITVFPAAKRVGYEESKRTTEDNLLKLNRLSSNAKNLNQMFEDPDDNAYIIFSIYGYYFRCLKTDIPTTSNLKAYIKLENDPADDIGWRLASTDVEGGALDGSEDSEGSYFKGLAFTNGDIPDDEESSEGIIGKYYGLSVTYDEEGNLILQELKIDSTEIRDGVSDKNITEKFTTDALEVGNVTATGNLSIDGNLLVKGSTTLEDNLIEINSGQTGTPLATLKSGIEINRGDLDNFLFVFDELDDRFKVGVDSGLQTVATRLDDGVMVDRVIPMYDATTHSFINSDVQYNPIQRTLDIYGGINIAKYSGYNTDPFLICYSSDVIKASIGSSGKGYFSNLDVDGQIVGNQPAEGNTTPLMTLYNEGVTKFQVGYNGNIRANIYYGYGLNSLTSVNDANIQVGINGTVIERNVNDSNPALKVNKLTGDGNIIEIQYNSMPVVTIDWEGNIDTNKGRIYTNALLSTVNGNSANIDLSLTEGVTISNDDNNDATTLTINKITGGGNIIEATYGFEDDQDLKFSVDKDGNVRIGADAVYYGGGLYALNDPNNAMIELGTSGVSIARNVANHIPALTVSSFSGTGKIFDVESGSTSRFAVDNNGDIIIGDTTFTQTDISKLKDDNVLMDKDVEYVALGGTILTDYSLFSKRLVKANTYEVLYTGRISIGLASNEFQAVVNVSLPGISSGLQYPNLQIRTQGHDVYTGEHVYASIKSGDDYFTITYEIPGSGTHPIGAQDFDFSIRGIEVITT